MHHAASIRATGGPHPLRRRAGTTSPGCRRTRITALGIARTFQNQRLFNQMTVLENVLVGMHCRTRAGLAGDPARHCPVRAPSSGGRCGAREELLGLLRRAARAARRRAGRDSLSYANRRRLEIARALATEPRLLLLDEPAAGMNPTETRELMARHRAHPRPRRTILLIEHDMRLVQRHLRRAWWRSTTA